MPAQFDISAPSTELVAQFEQELELPRFVAATLAARGISTLDEAQAFLNPALEKDWRDPHEIPDIDKAADIIEAAIRANKRIVVFGDFDLDGISATTVLTRGLRALGNPAKPFIPERFDEGYGLTASAYERVKTLSPDLMVTVDCGVANKHEIARILGEGIDIVVTDHHEGSDLVPEGIPVVDPKLDPHCQSSILAGVGVALKLVQVLGGRFGYPHLWRSYTDFAALGTVADLMPLVGENRALVTDGLAHMNANARPCIVALMQICGIEGKKLTSTGLSYTLIPRLNAAGRMGDAQVALDLLMSDDYATCYDCATKLEAINDQRRAIEAELASEAKEIAQASYKGERVIVVAGEGWHEGVKGIVATRLVGIYGVPALLFTIVDNEARGSGRTAGDVNLFAAVESCSDLLTRFGGHNSAVGVTLPAENLPAFKERLCAFMDTLPADAFHPKLTIDAEVKLGELTLDTVAYIDKLAPFGQSNPTPVYLARNVSMKEARAVGADKNHFACVLTDGRADLSAIMFRCATLDTLLESEQVVDAAFSPQIDEWRGRYQVKAMVEALEPTSTCAAYTACIDPQALNFVEGLFDSAASEQQPTSPLSNGLGASDSHTQADVRAHWEAIAADNPDQLEQAIIASIIGQGNSPHASQRAVLDHLRRGESVFAVMATGRGKSLTFQTYAAFRALTDHAASLFIYPLRALIADQAFHLSNSFAQFGLTCKLLTGESSAEERARVYEGLAQKTIDVVLTTPEYLSFHAEEIAQSGRIGFMVVDEAHHIGQAKAGNRLAYAELGRVAHILGNPVVLACSATAPDEIATEIERSFAGTQRVLDNHVRANLHIDDQRGLKNRDDYLAHLIAMGEKTVIYVNSREQSVVLARMLRRRVPQLALTIGFYNAGLSRDERNRIEQLFRLGDITVLIATSAFGEGINIPNVRHVVLYHMPFSEVEFNQMAGRAGRDGADAWVHLLYGSQDAALNEGILADMTPDHDVMAALYRHLRTLQRSTQDVSSQTFFPFDTLQIAAEASSRLRAIAPSAAECAYAVFRELGLIDTHETFVDDTTVREVHVREDAAKVELNDSVRYCEGIIEREQFKAFCSWAVHADVVTLTERVTHAILPGHTG